MTEYNLAHFAHPIQLFKFRTNTIVNEQWNHKKATEAKKIKYGKLVFS
jgi:hypothetical protein